MRHHKLNSRARGGTNRVVTRDGKISEENLSLHASRQVNQAQRGGRCSAGRGPLRRFETRSFPTAENFFDLVEHGFACEIADHDQKASVGE